MRKSAFTLMAVVLMMSAMFLLAGCGGGGSSTPAPGGQNAVPDPTPAAKWAPDGDVTKMVVDANNPLVYYMTIEVGGEVFVAEYVDGQKVWQHRVMQGANFFANALLSPKDCDFLLLIATNGIAGKETDGQVSILKLSKTDGTIISLTNIPNSTTFLDVKLIPGEISYQLLLNKTVTTKAVYVQRVDFDGTVLKEMKPDVLWQYQFYYIDGTTQDTYMGGTALSSAILRLNILKVTTADLTNPLVSQQRAFAVTPIASDEMTDLIVTTTPTKKLYAAGKMKLADGTYYTAIYEVGILTAVYTEVARMTGSGRLTNLNADAAGNLYGIMRTQTSGVETCELYKWSVGTTTLTKLATLTGHVTDLMVDASNNAFVMYRSITGYSYPSIKMEMFDTVSGAKLN